MIGIIAAMDVEMKSLRSFMTDTKTETVSGITFVSGTLEGKLVVTAVCIPLSRFGERYSARELELPFDGTVYIAPAVSGYVGGDITADLLWAQLDRAERPTLLIDVGTNGEMALGDARRLLCCSTAAGPAFEGAQISCGMTAAPGAISQVCWRDGGLSCSVVGGIPARGICGSGLIDAVAVMLDLGAIDETGRMLNVDEDEEEDYDSEIEDSYDDIEE